MFLFRYFVLFTAKYAEMHKLVCQAKTASLDETGELQSGYLSHINVYLKMSHASLAKHGIYMVLKLDLKFLQDL